MMTTDDKLEINTEKDGSIENRFKAQGVLEFALVLPIVLLLVLGIIEFGRLLFIYSATTSSSREAARYGASTENVGGGTRRYVDCPGIRDAAKRVGILAGIQDGNIVIEYDDGSTPYAFVCDDGPDPSEIDRGDRILVSVTAFYQPVVPLVNVPPIPISSTTARTIIKDVGISGTPRPTNTPLPTATPTGAPTFTPSMTPTTSDTPTATLSPTITDTPTITPTPSDTPTPTNTPTPTDTPTITPTFTPTPECPQTTSFQKQASKKLSLGIINPTPGQEIGITQIQFWWPSDAGNLKSVTFLDLNWSGSQAPPTFIYSPGWTGFFDQQDMLFTLDANLVSGVYHAVVYFDRAHCGPISGDYTEP